ncbi:MAG TPA: hypothetical protein VHJ69_08735 [Gemmatimonadales bacterium]|jgi:hypothetical protein|nr:hypothetical protein [Gemmatimonadales bacterium]
MPQSDATPADELTRALRDTLRAALDALPEQVLHQPDQLAARLAPALAISLADAADAAGATARGLGRALVARGASGPSAQSIESRVLGALTRHPSGRSPGVTPDSLASLTGLSAAVLGPAVSALVQAGGLVRDAWLVRLPHPDDLLPDRRLVAGERTVELRHASERRAIGDRRAVGERRLYDRRLPR